MGRRPTRRNQPPRFTEERPHYTESQKRRKKKKKRTTKQTLVHLRAEAEKEEEEADEEEAPFTLEEKIQHMEKAFHDAKDAELDQRFFQRIAREMNVASRLTGHKAIQWRQVKAWHEHHIVRSASPVMSNTQVSLPHASLSNNTPESSSDIHRGNAGEGTPNALEIEYEARSARDGAWYDVAAFLEERLDSSGELEVRVRYQGFSSEEDEWVNLKKEVRTRSIPLESSECHKVAVGDLVLCFWEEGDAATYYDAHVIEIERKLHDIRGCRCIFLISYDHDQAEERVHLRRLCRRP